MKTNLKNTGILLAITLVAVTALAFVYERTKEPIARAEQAQKAAAYQQVYEAASSFDDCLDGAALRQFNDARTDGSSVEEILAAKDAAGETLGYVLTAVSTKGYGGEIKLALGIDKTGTVVGYAVLNHSESPGFGANCENADVREQFIGITGVDEVDGISGATYTTNALKQQTQAALELVAQMGGDAQ